jgi:hypothetical protein
MDKKKKRKKENNVEAHELGTTHMPWPFLKYQAKLFHTEKNLFCIHILIKKKNTLNIS